MLITPVIFAIAGLPAALYLILMGRYRLSRRPLVTTGWRDTALLGIAVLGLVAIGPMQLFFPTYAAARFAGWVWGMLVALYLLTLFLIVLASRPRLIVYGLSEESFMAALLDAAKSVDDQSLCMGQVVTMPTVGLQLVIEPTGTPGVQQASSITGLASAAPWIELERALARRCNDLPATSHRASGLWLSALGVALLMIAVVWVISDPASSWKELREFVVR